MNSKVAFIAGMIIGLGLGAAGTYSYFKDKYEKLAEEKTADSRTVDKPSITEYVARLQKEGYVN